MEDKQLIVITKAQMDELIKRSAEAAAEATMKTIREERKLSNKRMKDRRLHNTELLLRNYNMFKLSAEDAVYNVRQLEREQSANEILNLMMNKESADITMEQIKESKIKTAIILGHIDTMLELYHIFCERSADELDIRRYEILIDRFISQPALSVKEIADKQCISKESVYGDLKIAKERVSALLFGVDGVQLR